MSAWTSPVPILEDEDEAQLRTDFIELWRRFPKHDVFEVAQHFFRNKRDPLRYLQAAHQWGNELEMKDRLEKAIIAGGEENAKLTDKELRLKELRELATAHHTPTRDRIAAYKLIAEMQGEISKPVDVTSKGKKLNMPNAVVLAPYAD